MAKRKRYDDKFRATSVVMLTAAGYPDMKGALQQTADHLKVPARTLSRWFNAESNPPPAILVNEKKEELADLFENAAYEYVKHSIKRDVVEDTRGKDAIMAAAVATDKMRLLRGLPTEIIVLVPGFIEAIKKLGQDPQEVMKRAINRAGLGDQYLQ
jgi:hypothetical protein